MECDLRGRPAPEGVTTEAMMDAISRAGWVPCPSRDGTSDDGGPACGDCARGRLIDDGEGLIIVLGRRPSTPEPPGDRP